MEIKKVSLVGLGALGVMFGNQLQKTMEKGSFKVVADRDRIKKYEEQGIYSNGEKCSFEFQAEDEGSPADLVIFAVKYNGLADAIKSMRHQIGENTIIISTLNGIKSEEVLGEAFGHDKVVYCVAQGMDAVKEGNALIYKNMGMLVIGEKKMDEPTERVLSLQKFLNSHGVKCEIENDMYRKMWSKFMLNVGVNQVVSLYGGTYGEIHKEGPSREMMKSAMREVIALSEKEGVNLTEADLEYWMGILKTLSPDGKPSMRQDVEARRMSELELFAGTVLELGRKHGIDTPVNQEIFDRITEMEKDY
ncbi:ketopantoate reductase family protein [Youngiibacter multivorans]|uniref:2-dehydropantoate 2-reductase n=1 Tax=Youngiibacter multivorans TaxID=937251 RepID=A0ABS4G5N1_9CLOT|nr:ketopantoate reductase family protein [Youngiibacter multivorans]MBP1919849.1 2-dehydropantoate 2-reductase [Youngiibacter multivorans]